MGSRPLTGVNRDSDGSVLIGTDPDPPVYTYIENNRMKTSEFFRNLFNYLYVQNMIVIKLWKDRAAELYALMKHV